MPNLLLFFLFAYIRSSRAYSIIGNTIYDLETTSFTDFTAEASSWSPYPGLVNGVTKVSACWGSYILGGHYILASPQGYFQKTYSSLPTHNTLSLSVRIYQIDTWETGTPSWSDSFQIQVDSGAIISGWNLVPIASDGATNGCGALAIEMKPLMFYVTMPHSSGTLNLKVYSHLDQASNDESLGFRDLTLDFLTLPSPPSSPSYCGVTAGNPLPYNWCSCQTNQYADPNFPQSGICINCDSSCATCSGSATNCLTCPTSWFMVGTNCYPTCSYPLYSYVSGGVTYCTTPCPGQYVWWDQSCSSSCTYADVYGEAYTLQPATVNAFLQCNYPCGTTAFLYFNSSCISACPSPLVSLPYKSRNLCAYPCGTAQYLYWNATCINTCPWPLSPEIQGIAAISQRNFCWYSCQPGQFLYWNGSCLNSCPSPLTIEIQGTNPTRQFCWYICPPTQYLYWNGSCLNNCPWPLSPETQGTYLPRQFCWYTCPPSQHLYWNGSCISTCPWPLTPETQGTYLPRQFCWYNCQPAQYLYWNGSCLNSCPWPLSPETQGTYLPRHFCWYYCQPSQYLYWNGSCLSSCPWPLSPETQGTYLPRQFCWYLCQPNQYLYWNLSCIDSCPAPLTSETQGTNVLYQRKFCWYTCQPNQFLLWNYTCSSTCPYPLTNEVQGTYLSRKFCWYPCMPWQWLNWDGTCQSSCNAPLWPETQGTRRFCWYPCSSETKFLYWNGTCLPECPDPLSTRYENGQWFCDYPCSDTTKFLYWNGSCISTCNSPFLSKIEGSPARRFCYYPCQVDEFVYWDNTCQTTCDFPLAPNFEGTPARKFCWYLCSTNQYLYWNGTCSSQCDPPFLQRTVNSRQFCDYPCSSNQYLYWNGSCLNTCLFPFVTQVQGTVFPKSFCWYPCPPSQFLYWNGTCDNTCPSPLVQETQGSSIPRKFCWYPCQPTKYLYWNGSCLDACPSPLAPETQGTRLFCWTTCDSSKFLYWNGSCLNDCPSPLIQETQALRKFCWYPCKPSQWVYWDQTCQEACPTPLWSEIQGTRQFCWYPCLISQFLYWNGSCLTQCDPPLTQRTANNQKFCDYPCKSYQYLYWNGSCIDSCPAPLSPRLEGGNPTIQLCDYPCPVNQILYWDGACLSSCDSPLVINTQGTPPRNFCWYLCSLTDYLYWNGTCLSQCNYPLSKKTSRGRNFCTYACPDNKYLTSDGSCVNDCPSEYFENEALGFCQPCQDSLCLACSSAFFGTKCQLCKDPYILNSDGVCNDCQVLSSEFIEQLDDSNTYLYKLRLSPASCDLDETTLRQSLLPTQDAKNQFPPFSYQINQTYDFTGKYFLLEIQFQRAVSSDNSLDFALGPLKIGLQIPRNSEPTQSTANNEVKATFAAVTGSTLSAALTVGATAALWSLISFQQFISYFIYLNIQLPPHLIYFLTMFDNVNLEILPNPLASLTDRLAELWDSLVNNSDPKYQLPNKFEEFDTPTLFVINAGSTFFVCMILFILPYFFDFLRKYRDLGNLKFMRNIHSGLRWNIPIRVFLESGIPLTFAFLVQMRKVSYGNVPYAISTVTASLAFVYICFMINYISQTLRNSKHEHLKDPSVEESIGTLFEGLLLKKEKPSGKYYYLLILFRGMLLVFVDVFVDHLPLIQTTIMALFNLVFVYYVCVVIEFESRYLTWANRIKEVLILLVELLFMTLCPWNTTEEWRNLAGWVIICMLGLTLAMELLFGFYLQILAARNFVKRIREFLKKLREHCKKRKQRIAQEPPTPSEETSRNVLTIET